MQDSTLYHLARLSEHSIGRDRWLLCDLDAGQVVDVDSSVRRFIHLCQGARTVAGHVTEISQTIACEAHVIRDALTAFVNAGILRPVASFGNHVTPSDEAASRISLVGIITADRPDMTKRAIQDAMAHALQNLREIHILVVDGSRDVRNQADTEAAVRRAARNRNGVLVTYVGPEKKRAIIARLAARGFDRTTLTWSLCSGTTGANRNVLLLMTAGHHVLMADDDVRWTTWRLPGQELAVSFGGHEDPTEMAFFPTRGEAIAAAVPLATDMLAVHETLLGREASSFLPEGPDLTHACPHLLHALTASQPLTVRVTMSGIAGDAGMYCPYNLLFTPGRTRAALAASAEMFERAVRSRETHRITRRSIVMHDGLCMAACMGLQNTEVLPPFMPAGRGEDAMFGGVLAFADPRALFAYLPWGVIHDSVRPSRRPSGPILSATQTRLIDIVLALVRVARAGAIPGAPSTTSKRLQNVARVFSEAGNLSASDFRALLIETMAQATCRNILQLEAMLASGQCFPKQSRKRAERFRDQFLASVVDPKFFCPVEFSHTGSVEAGFQATQVFFQQLGNLLGAWPDLWETARESGPELFLA